MVHERSSNSSWIGSYEGSNRKVNIVKNPPNQIFRLLSPEIKKEVTIPPRSVVTSVIKAEKIEILKFDFSTSQRFEFEGYLLSLDKTKSLYGRWPQFRRS